MAYWILLFFTILSMAILLAHLFVGYPEGQSFLGDATNFATLAGLFYIIDETNQMLKKERQATNKEETLKESLVERNKNLEIQIENLKLDLKQKNEELRNYRSDIPTIKESLENLEGLLATIKTESIKSTSNFQNFNERLRKIEEKNKKKYIFFSFIEFFLKKGHY